jgi:anti-sigma regulatory factor (Ser/Thr protein kinase)
LANPVVLAVTEASQIGEARRLATTLARRMGFEETQGGKVALVVTEAAGNLVKHASGGEILLRPLEQGGVGGIEILVLDKGPGMADLDRCLRDGFSSAGTPGTGLGAIARLSDFLEIHTQSQVGTALLARLWSGPPAGRASGWEVGAAHVPAPRETVCGDAWAVEENPDRCLILVADGLGHGEVAAQAAREAERIFRAQVQLEPAELIQVIHDALRSTRGAAVAVAEIDLGAQVLRFAGVGNISGTILAGDTSRSMVSHNGTVGHVVRKVQEFTYPFPREALLVMNSDGLTTHWRLDPYPGLALRHPSLIAGFELQFHHVKNYIQKRTC